MVDDGWSHSERAVQIIDASLVPVEIEICLLVPDSMEVPGNVPKGAGRPDVISGSSAIEEPQHSLYVHVDNPARVAR